MCDAAKNADLRASALNGRRILIVEDDYLVAQALVELLEEAGAEIIGPIGWLEEALVLIEDEHRELDAAVLDVNLHGKKSYPIADALAARAVKFIFATGYSADGIEGQYQQYPRCEKPIDLSALLAAMNK